MELRADARIPFPPQVVFTAYRDELVDLVPHLSNVRSIEVRSRKEDGGVVEMVNVWHGGGEIPGPIRAVLSESVLEWTDYATWRADSLACDWRTETHAFGGAVSSRGTNRFIDDGAGKTLFEIRGNLEVDAKKIRGMPSFVANKIGRAVEEFLVGRIQSTLIETAKGLSSYLEQRSR